MSGNPYRTLDPLYVTWMTATQKDEGYMLRYALHHSESLLVVASDHTSTLWRTTDGPYLTLLKVLPTFSFKQVFYQPLERGWKICGLAPLRLMGSAASTWPATLTTLTTTVTPTLTAGSASLTLTDDDCMIVARRRSRRVELDLVNSTGQCIDLGVSLQLAHDDNGDQLHMVSDNYTGDIYVASPLCDAVHCLRFLTLPLIITWLGVNIGAGMTCMDVLRLCASYLGTFAYVLEERPVLQGLSNVVGIAMDVKSRRLFVGDAQTGVWFQDILPYSVLA